MPNLVELRRPISRSSSYTHASASAFGDGGREYCDAERESGDCRMSSAAAAGLYLFLVLSMTGSDAVWRVIVEPLDDSLSL